MIVILSLIGKVFGGRRGAIWAPKIMRKVAFVQIACFIYYMLVGEVGYYSLPSINVNPREWIKINIYRGVNS